MLVIYSEHWYLVQISEAFRSLHTETMKIPSSTPYIVYAQISELVYSSLGGLVLPTKETVPELCVYRKYLVYCVLKHLESPAFSNDLTSKDEVLPLYVNISFTSCPRG